MIIGKINAISMSKIKKITLIIKNCNENGIRLFVKLSNPHSNGEFFSWFFDIFFIIKKFNNNIKIMINKIK